MTTQWLATTRRPCRYKLAGSIFGTADEFISCVPFVLGSQQTLGLVVLSASISDQLDRHWISQVGWTLRYLFSSADHNVCQDLVQEAVDTVQRHCEQACGSVDTPGDWPRLDKLNPEQLRLLLTVFILGFSLYILIDVFCVAKEWWRVRVHFWIRSWSARPSNIYALPHHASR